MVLGEGAMTAAGVSGKAANLDRARAAGLAVPAGVVVLDRASVAEAAIAAAHRVSGAVAVRSAFSVEDRADSAMAGHFHTELDVAPDADALSAAIAAVRASGDASFRRDVIIMEMVSATSAGVAFSEPGWPDDLVNHVSGLADGLVGGLEAGKRVSLPRFRRWEGRLPFVASGTTWQSRLQLLLRDVRQKFGDSGWDIEWADDGTECYLVQIRPITVPTRRDEVFTMANHREILPDPPSTLMTSLIVTNGNRFDGPLGMLRGARQDRPFIEEFDGRPYLNQSLITDFLVGLGLPTSMVSDALGGHDADARGLKPARILAATPSFVRLGVRTLIAKRSAAKTASTMLDELSIRSSSFGEATERAGITYVHLVDEMASLATAMAGPVGVLRSLGVLSTHLRTQRSAGTRMADDLVPIAARARQIPGAFEELRAGRLPDDAEVQRLWQVWLDRHGHRGRFESDLASPRFADEPETVLSSVPSIKLDASDSGGAAVTQSPARSLLVTLTRPLWALASGPMQAREQLRSDAMVAFAHHRHELLRLADEIVADGRLPSGDDLWLLTLEDLARLDRGESLSAADMGQRRSARRALVAIDVPDLRRRFGPIEVEAGGSNGTAGFGLVEPGRWRGLSLSPGRVSGRAWVLTTPSVDPPDGFDPATTVLVARSVDAGWIPTFSLVSAVVVEIGGDLSHGSIILRELGVPAITNVAGITRTMETGEQIELDAGAGSLVQSQSNELS